MAATLVQPCGSGCAGCATPEVSFTCASRTGSGYLRGWSKFQNFNSGDWNERKLTKYAQAFDGWICVQRDAAPCLGLLSYDPVSAWLMASGFAAWDLSANTIDSSEIETSGYAWVKEVHGGTNPGCGVEHTSGDSLAGYVISISSSPDACGNAWAVVAPLDDYIPYVLSNGYDTVCPPPRSFAQSDTQRSAGAASAICFKYARGSCDEEVCGNPDTVTGFRAGGGGGTVTLTVPDSVYAALARGTSTTGTLCKTTGGTIGSTSDASTTQIAVSGTTSVVATLACTGLVSGHDYRITLTISRYVAGGGAFVDTYEETIDFTASGTTEDIDYHVPVNTDYDYALAAAGDVVIEDIT